MCVVVQVQALCGEQFVCVNQQHIPCVERWPSWRVLWFTVDLAARPISSPPRIREHPVLTWIWKTDQPTLRWKFHN